VPVLKCSLYECCCCLSRHVLWKPLTTAGLKPRPDTPEFSTAKARAIWLGSKLFTACRASLQSARRYQLVNSLILFKFVDIVETEVRGIILGLELALKIHMNGLSAVDTRQVVILLLHGGCRLHHQTYRVCNTSLCNQEDCNNTVTATRVECTRPGGMGSGTHWIFSKRVG